MKKINYGMYDFANSSFSAIIITFIFSTYFARQIVGDVQLGAAYWQWTTGVCGLLIALTGPYLGIVADKRKNGLINFLRIFTILCILITCLFWFSKPEASFIFYTLIIFLCSNYCYEIAQIFYNSLLQQSSEKNKLGSTSGLGFGLGYLGTIPVLLIVLYFFILSDTVLFDLNKQEFENIRFTALIVALWFLLFAIPMLFFFKDKTSKDIKTSNFNFKSMKTHIDKFFKKNKRIDYLVNTAGVLWFDKDVSAVNIDDKVWDKVFQINLKSMVFLSKLIVPKMIKNKFGSMVHISSIDALSGDDKPQDAYGASKAAMIRLSKSFAIQFARNKIRSNVILPGPIDTGMQVRWKKNPKAKKNLEKFIPLNKVGKPEDISNASLFLLSDQANYITGTELIVDGGITSKP